MLTIRYHNHPLKIKSEKNWLKFNINQDIDLDSARNAFNEAIALLMPKLGVENYSMLRICERNIFMNDFFMDFCYIQLITKLSFRHPKLIIYSNNIALYEYFKNSKSVNISLGSKLIFKKKSITSSFAKYFRFAYFLLKSLNFHRNVSKNNSPHYDLSNTTIIQTWVSDKNFADTEFQDSYYKELRLYLKEQNRKCLTWPVFYTVEQTKKALRFISNNSDQFLMPENFLDYKDYNILLSHFCKLKKIKINDFKIINFNLTRVFNYHLKKEIPTYASIVYRFIEKLAEKNFKDVKVIINHENMIVEKMLLLAREKFFPQMSVLGYFHTTKPKNQLCLEYAGKNVCDTLPKPDKIIFNSSKYCSYYSKKYPQLNCKNGYAFKQAYINHIPIEPGSDSKILVCLSGNMNDSILVLELLNKIKNKTADLEFIFKFHPMNFFELNNICKLTKYKVSNLSLPELYGKVKKVISPYSACLLEAALVGKDVGFIYNPEKLLLNPFDDTGIINYKLIADESTLINFLKRPSHTSPKFDFFNTDKTLLSAFMDN